MPPSQMIYEFDSFPPFFDGLLPEGYQLDGLLKFAKIDRNDLFAQLVTVGDDLVGNVTVKEIII
jgi:serine/threonine-protein kinase HipA